MSPEVHPLLDLHARCHHKWGGSGDIQETEKGNCLLNISWQNNLIAKHHRILKIYNRICWRHLCWRPPPCSWSHRQLGPEGLPLLSSRSFTMIVLPRVTMTSITFLGRHAGFPQTMWMWFWLLMRTVNNILVTVVSLCEIGPRCNHDVPQLRVLEGNSFLKKSGRQKKTLHLLRKGAIFRVDIDRVPQIEQVVCMAHSNLASTEKS